MKIIGKFFLTLYGFVMTVFSMISVAMLSLLWTDKISYDILISQIEYYFTYPLSFPIAITLFSVIFLISFILMFLGITRKEPRDPIIISTDSGQIAITLEAFESIASATLKKIPEAKEYNVKVRNIKSNINVAVKILAVPDANIPELGKTIQAKVIEAIETNTGVKVLGVRIKVENIYNNSGIKSKVE